MWTYLLFFLFLSKGLAEEEDFRLIKLDSGIVRGNKFWNGDYYEFYGIPYAKMPTGRNRFKGPEPVEPWEDVLFATNNNMLCHQCYYTEEAEGEVILAGDDKCLTMNVLVPKSVSEDKLVPVIAYIHSGAFSGGSGNMAKFGYLARHDIIVVSFNYRVGAYGFACLGNEEIPGNAGLKDQVAALRWIKKNIKNFGGDPHKITLAGFSVGAAMAELLALSKATDGIINQLILESGSALSPFAINRDPVNTAWNVALSAGYHGSANLDELTDFYLNAETKELALKSLNYFLPNSTFGFAPCIEKVQDGVEAIVTESPLETLKRGDYDKIPVLTGFSNMEGLSRSIKFGTWREGMNENFADFLPADLKFPSEKEQTSVIHEIKQHYFNGKNVTAETLAGYIDYFSDAMFKYGIMKSAKQHAAVSQKPVYLYEFSYVGNLNIQHNYMERIKGASHRDQTAYLLDFFGFTNNYRDLDTRERMTTMWTDYVQYGNPTEFESHIISVKWPTYTKDNEKYLEINKRLQVKQGLFDEEFHFWDKIYEKYYLNPTTVVPLINVPLPKESAAKSGKVAKKNEKHEFTKSSNKEENKEQQVDTKLNVDENKEIHEMKKTTTKTVEGDGKLKTPAVSNNDNKQKQVNETKNKEQNNQINVPEAETHKSEKVINDEHNKQKLKIKKTTTIKSVSEDGKLKTDVIKEIEDSEQSRKENIGEKQNSQIKVESKMNKNEEQKDKPTENKPNSHFKRTTTIKTLGKDKKIKTRVIQNGNTVQVGEGDIEDNLPKNKAHNVKEDSNRKAETVI